MQLQKGSLCNYYMKCLETKFDAAFVVLKTCNGQNDFEKLFQCQWKGNN